MSLLPGLITALAGLGHAVRVEDGGQLDDQLVQLELKEEFIVSCSASAPYQYCKFASPLGQYCNFYWGGVGLSRSKQFCVGLKDRVTFVGSQEDYECALLIRGAESGDSGQWTCEVGSPPGRRRQRRPRWSQTGELHIRVIIPGTAGNETLLLTTGSSEPTTMMMTKASLALLVVCVLVFVVFVGILVSVIFINNKKKKDAKTKPVNGEEIAKEEAEKNKILPSPVDAKLEGEISFMKSVFPHIMSFPNKDPGLNL